MKILIMGSEGIVGQNLVKGLSEKHDVLRSDQIDSDGKVILQLMVVLMSF